MALATHANPVKLYCVICKKLPQYAIGQYAAYGVTYVTHLVVARRWICRFPFVPISATPSAYVAIAFRSSFVSEKRSMYSFSQPHEPRARRARAPPSAARRCHDSINIPERVWKLNTARRHRPRARGPARPRPRNSRIVDVDPYYHVYYTFNSRSVRHSSQGRRVHMQTPTMKTLRALIDLAISRCNI